MSNYKNIQNLIQKYSTKQPQEKWSSVANHKYRNWKILEENMLFLIMWNITYQKMMLIFMALLKYMQRIPKN